MLVLVETAASSRSAEMQAAMALSMAQGRVYRGDTSGELGEGGEEAIGWFRVLDGGDGPPLEWAVHFEGGVLTRDDVDRWRERGGDEYDVALVGILAEWFDAHPDRRDTVLVDDPLGACELVERHKRAARAEQLVSLVVWNADAP